MEGIAHLFLSGERPQRVGPARQKAGGDGSVVNRGQSRAGGDCSDGDGGGGVDELGLVDGGGGVEELGGVDGVAAGPRKMAGRVVLADHLAGYAEKVVGYGAQLAGRVGAVGLLYLDGCEASLVELVAGGVDVGGVGNVGQADGEGAVGAGAVGSGVAGVEVLDELAELFAGKKGDNEQAEGVFSEGCCSSLGAGLVELSGAADEVLVVVGEDQGGAIEKVAHACGRVTVFSGARTEDMVRAYERIKWLASREVSGVAISLFVSEVEDRDAACAVYDKLAGTAREFLGIWLQWAGYGLAGEHRFGDDVTEREMFSGACEVEPIGEVVRFLEDGRQGVASERPMDSGLRGNEIGESEDQKVNIKITDEESKIVMARGSDKGATQDGEGRGDIGRPLDSAPARNDNRGGNDNTARNDTRGENGNLRGENDNLGGNEKVSGDVGSGVRR